LQTVRHRFNIYARRCDAMTPRWATQTRYTLRRNTTSTRIMKCLVFGIHREGIIYSSYSLIQWVIQGDWWLPTNIGHEFGAGCLLIYSFWMMTLQVEMIRCSFK